MLSFGGCRVAKASMADRSAPVVACNSKLRDNVPIFGYLALGGRCRSCGLPISVRYPIVELLVGISITLVAASELFQFNLPDPDPRVRGAGWNSLLDGALISTAIYHSIAIAILWAMGLIRMDGQRLPAKLVVFALVTMGLPMLIYPRLMIVPWQLEVADSWRPDQRYLDAILRLITAAATAIFLARSLARSLCPTADPKTDPLGQGTARLVDLIMIMAIPIVVVGWQASVAVAPAASIIAVLLRRWLPAVDAMGALRLRCHRL